MWLAAVGTGGAAARAGLTVIPLFKVTSFMSRQVGKPRIIGPFVSTTRKAHLLVTYLCVRVSKHVPYCLITRPPNAVILLVDGFRPWG